LNGILKADFQIGIDVALNGHDRIFSTRGKNQYSDQEYKQASGNFLLHDESFYN
jgi:hypothetical protein